MSYAENGTDITYKYDADGLRTQKIVNGVKHDYFYEDGQLIYEIKDGVYELYYKYDADDNLFSITRYRYSDGLKSVYYAVTNTRGDVIELRDQYGAIYAKYTYDSWGKLISATNVSGNALITGSLDYQTSIKRKKYPQGDYLCGYFCENNRTKKIKHIEKNIQKGYNMSNIIDNWRFLCFFVL